MTDIVASIEFPVLGEPVAIELANTRYRDEEIIDFLATPQLVSGWFDASPSACQLVRPRRWTAVRRSELAALRDAVHEVMHGLVDATQPSRRALDVLNAAVARTDAVVELHWSDGGPLRVERRVGADVYAALFGDLALRTIELITGPSADALRRCASDDCWMLFLKDHPRRRWCHNSCGHRHRQAAYYRRTHAPDGRRPG